MDDTVCTDDEDGFLQTAMAEVATSAADTAAARQEGGILSCSPHVSVWRRRLPSSALTAGAIPAPHQQQQQPAAGDSRQERSPFTSPLRQSLQRQYSQGDAQGLPSQDAVRKLVSNDSFGSHAVAKPSPESGHAAPASTGRHSRGPSHGAPNEVRLNASTSTVRLVCCLNAATNYAAWHSLQ